MSRQDVLITAEALAERLGSVVLLDVGAFESRRVEGIAGAIPVGLADFSGPPDGVNGARPLPNLADLQARVRQWGVNDDSEVVLYDDAGGLKAARGWWTLRWAGLGKVRLLDGGLAAAKAAGLPLAVGEFASAGKSGSATLTGGGLPQIDADGAAAYARAGRLIDARGAKAFRGDPSTGDGGHIEGAVNLPASANLDEAGHFLPDEALRQRLRLDELATHGDLGVSCGSGVSAAHTAAALAILDVTPALFVGSWSAWSADPGRPVSYSAREDA